MCFITSCHYFGPYLVTSSAFLLKTIAEKICGVENDMKFMYSYYQSGSCEFNYGASDLN